MSKPRIGEVDGRRHEMDRSGRGAELQKNDKEAGVGSDDSLVDQEVIDS
jgi:hypothetical protein